MANFNFPPDVTPIRINRKPTAFQCDFDLPEQEKDRLSADEVCSINGHFVMNFYSAPDLGHLVRHNGHVWRVVGVLHEPSKYLNRQQRRRVTVLKMKYLGPSPEEGIGSSELGGSDVPT